MKEIPGSAFLENKEFLIKKPSIWIPRTDYTGLTV
jgi:hypothetical protein